MIRRDAAVAVLGVLGGGLMLMSVFTPWYPEGGRAVFSCLTLLASRQGGPLLLQIFLMFFGGFTLLFGGILAKFLPARDTAIVLLTGTVISAVGVVSVLLYLKNGFILVNPTPRILSYLSTPVGWSGLFPQLSYGFYLAVAGVLTGAAGSILRALAPGRKSARRGSRI